MDIMSNNPGPTVLPDKASLVGWIISPPLMPSSSIRSLYAFSTPSTEKSEAFSSACLPFVNSSITLSFLNRFSTPFGSYSSMSLKKYSLASATSDRSFTFSLTADTTLFI